MRLLAFAVIAALGMGLGGLARADEAPRTINVTGTGVVETEPNMAVISLAVTHDAATAGEAMAQVSEEMTALLARLTALGIASNDVQTNRLSLNPIWDNRPSQNDEPPKIVGFVASNGVHIRVRGLTTLGSILDAVITEGANEMSGLRFTVDDPKPLQDAARARAVADALDKAEQLASAAGVTLGPLRTMSDSGGNRAPVMKEMSAARSVEVPLAAGEISLSASVSMSFDIIQ